MFASTNVRTTARHTATARTVSDPEHTNNTCSHARKNRSLLPAHPARGAAQEKTEIMDDLEDQEATTQLTALMLDKWQSYADELKKQIRHSGAEPLGWEDFKRGVRVC
jgi:hypothetical protein